MLPSEGTLERRRTRHRELRDCILRDVCPIQFGWDDCESSNMPSNGQQEVCRLEERATERVRDGFGRFPDAGEVDAPVFHVDDANVFHALNLVRSGHQDSITNW